MTNIYEAIDANKWKSAVVVAGFYAFIVLAVAGMSYAFGYGLNMIGFGFILGGISSLIGYFYSDKIVLAMSNARPADKKRDFQLFTVTENLAIAAQLPMPRLYVIEDTALNAFATGRDPQHAVVCATTGLLSKLNRTELEGVVAHELAHVKNYDIRLMSLVSVLVGFIALLADFALRFSFSGMKHSDRKESGSAGIVLFIAGVLLAMFTPLIAQIIQLAISKKRLYLPDSKAVKKTKFT